jgi:hypothetical protein
LFISQQDIGTTVLKGSSAFVAGVYTVTGSGSDIWSTADAFQFFSKTFSGDLEIAAHLIKQDSTNAWAKAGIMMRESLLPNAAYVAVLATPSNGIVMQYRGKTGDPAASATVSTGLVPCWLKIMKVTNSFTGYASTDGMTWKLLANVQVVMGNGNVGLAVTSHDTTKLGTATFDQVIFK